MTSFIRNIALLSIIILTGTNSFVYADADAKKTATELEQDFKDSIEKVRAAYVRIGGGSGVCFSPDGYMLTNHHVAGSNKIWTVTMPNYDGEEAFSFKATLLGQDPVGDICLLKIESDKPLPYVPLGDSDILKLGQPIIALGNPFSFALDSRPTVTIGMISALNKHQGTYTDAIQTDAAMNPGNSGGPMISVDGKLLGINGRVAVRFGNRINTGVAYAIPVNQIKNFMEVFKNAKGEVVEHGKLAGVHLSEEETAGHGVIVKRIKSNTHAADNGLKVGDVIVKINHYEILNLTRFHSVIGTYPAGASLKFTVERAQETVAMDIELDTLKTADALPFLAHLDTQYTGEGVRILRCEPRSGADLSGMSPGDIIVDVDGTTINSLADLEQLLNLYEVEEMVKVSFLREETQHYVYLELSPYPNN